MRVTCKQIREWMDKQIEAKKIQNERLVIEPHEDGIDDELANLSANEYIHIGSESVRFISDLLDIPMYVTKRRRDSENPYELTIFYKGEKFIGIETEAEYNERGAVV